jgi:hypothetical protein
VPASKRGINPLFLAIAGDARIIPGVHHYCDEWCAYCEVTNRCLGFRCTQVYARQRGRCDDDPPFRSIAEAAEFTRELAAVEGLPTDELDALTTGGDAGARLQTVDTLANVAWKYATDASRFLMTISTSGAGRNAPHADPSPYEVVLWFHVRIYMKLVRALVGKELTSNGTLERREDAIGCAKLTLVSIERSRNALLELDDQTGDRRITQLLVLLNAIEGGMEERFPDARSFIRVGLDVPAV